MINVTNNDVLDAMEKYGGSFTKSLSMAFRFADRVNFRILKESFPNYWEEYEEMARIEKLNK